MKGHVEKDRRSDRTCELAGLQHSRARRSFRRRHAGRLAGSDVGYPHSTQLSDDSVLTIYYITPHDRVIQIASTRGQKLLVDPHLKLVVVHRTHTGKNLTKPLRVLFAKVNNDQFLELVSLIIAASPEA